MRCVGLLAGAFAVCGVVAGAEENFQPPKVVREFQAEAVHQRGVGVATLYTPHSLGQRPSILHFWGTFCDPCMKELPGLLRFSRRNPTISIFAVAMDQESKDADRVLSRLHAYDTNILFFSSDQDWESDLWKYYMIGIPTTIFVNADGTIAAHQTGRMDWGSRKVQRAVEAFLQGRSFKLE